MEGLPTAGLHAVNDHFLVVVLGVEQWRFRRPHGLHPLCHLRVTVSHLEGVRGDGLPVWETLGKEDRSRLVAQLGDGSEAQAIVGGSAYLARPRVGKARMVALE